MCLTSLLLASLTLAAVLTARSQITFADPRVEAAVRTALQNHVAPITSNDMAGLIQLWSPFPLGFRNLGGLEAATNLQDLLLTGSPLTNLDTLPSLTSLQSLVIDSTGISNITFASSLTNLQYLKASQNQIRDISPLCGLPSLRSCYLGWNPITNVTALTNLPSLGSLHIESVPISTLEFIRGFPTLLSLKFGPCDVRSISCLTNLPWLNDLSIHDGSITNWELIGELNLLASLEIHRPLSPMTNIQFCSELTNLVDLVLTGFPETDLSPIASLNLQTLHLTNFPITNFSTVATQTNLWILSLVNAGLRDFGWIESLSRLLSLNISGNPITNWSATNHSLHMLRANSTGLEDLEFIHGFPQLTYLEATNNRIENIAPLNTLTNTFTASLQYNYISNLSAIVGLTSLANLNVGWNRIDLNPGTLGRLSIDQLDGKAIVDGQQFQPRLRALRDTDGSLLYEFTPSPKIRYDVESSSNLTNWSNAGFIPGSIPGIPPLYPITIRPPSQPPGYLFYRLRFIGLEAP
jgi:hypothetical protein